MTSDKPSFHKEGKSTIKIVHDNKHNPKTQKRPITPKDIPSQASSSLLKPQDSPFVEELVLTGRPNWKKLLNKSNNDIKDLFNLIIHTNNWNNYF